MRPPCYRSPLPQRRGAGGSRSPSLASLVQHPIPSFYVRLLDLTEPFVCHAKLLEGFPRTYGRRNSRRVAGYVLVVHTLALLNGVFPVSPAPLALCQHPCGLLRTNSHPSARRILTGIDENGRTFWEEPFDVKAGDYIDMRALMPCIIAVSACPGRSSGPGERALGLEIYEAD